MRKLRHRWSRCLPASERETNRCRDHCSNSHSAAVLLPHLQQILAGAFFSPRPRARLRSCLPPGARAGRREKGEGRREKGGPRGSERDALQRRPVAERGSASAPGGGGAGLAGNAHAPGGGRGFGAKRKTVAGKPRGGGRWPTRSGMEHLERCARLLRGTLVRAAVRRYLPWALAFSMLAGSVLKELSPLPESYLSNKRNVLNVYFVKLAWAWTFCLLLPFIALTNYHLTGRAGLVLRRLSTLLVGTAIWYVCTAIFSNIEHYTGSCYQSPTLEGVRKEHQSKQQCHGEGGFWHGFDISGHSFLLTFCALMIVEEMAVLHELKMDRSHCLHTAITTLVVALGFLTFIWVWMFLCTAVYFHNLSQKVFGTLFGLLGWYGTYGFWYLKSFSPGLPPQTSSLNSKQDSYKK
ncbi:unnamed protein product [Nyctereutes procyonoides]|uniref:(raccoon dog) hypothetical protein n=2 Tax=Nyctereutes procyonoides TaxID=34880 RepID=A0A811XV71_NYCPR|nr:unnamed protein product [Nyctereutes procyonoides]